jgi:membrane protease YdiL (CAAX protease family)
MRDPRLKSNNLLANLWMRWWLFWLGYALFPSLLVSIITSFLPALLADQSVGLLSVRAFMLLIGYFLMPTVQQYQLKQSLLKRLSLKEMFQVVGVFVVVLLLGLGFFTWVEYAWAVSVVETNRTVLATASFSQMVTIIILAPVVEETWFRHWLLGSPAGLRRSPWLGFVYGWQDFVSVVLFGLLHASADYWGLKAVVWASVMGLFFLWVRRYTGSLTACIALHTLHNSLLLFL